MVLKKWDKIIKSEMGAFYPDKDDYDVLPFPKNLSPITNFSLDIFANMISGKNMIINYPDFKLKPASLFSYIYAEKTNKNIYILADEKGDSLNSNTDFSINKNHYLLCDYDQLIFKRLPIFYLKKNKKKNKKGKKIIQYKLTLKKHLIRANNSFKRGYTEEKVLNDTTWPKIILDTDKNMPNIEKTLEHILKRKDKHINSGKHRLGLIIIENADRFFHYAETTKKFISWFKQLNVKIKLLIHFNNPSIEIVKLLVKELNFCVLPFNKYILENNEYLRISSEEYFNNKNMRELTLVNRYNLDSRNVIQNRFNISIHEPLIYSGSIDKFFYEAYYIYKKIDIEEVFNKQELARAKKLLFDLYNLTVNPSYLKIYFKINNNPITGSVTLFIENFKRILYKEKSNTNKFLIHSFLDSLSNMYYELTNCKRINEDLSYTRENKDYILYKLLIYLFENGEKVYVGTYFDTEPKILEEILKKGYPFDDDTIVPISIKMLTHKQDTDKEGKILVLPGVIPEEYKSELFKPYKKIIILAYEGNNHKIIKEQINKEINSNITEEKEYMDYLRNILKRFDANMDNEILNDFDERFKLVEFKEETGKKQTSNNEPEKNLSEKEDNPFHIDFRLNDYIMEWHDENSKQDIDISSKVNQTKYDTLSLRLQNIKTEEFVEKKLPVNKSYLTFNNVYDIEDAKELKPSELNRGDYVIIIDNDEKKSLLNLVIDTSDFDSQIDMNTIEYWKLEFLHYIESKSLKYSEIYNIYNNKGGTKTYQTVLKWCKGETMGPQSEHDLYIIGLILNDDYILMNYKSIFHQISLVRTSHRQIGRKLKKMIKSILTDEYLDVSHLSENEYLIYDNIQNGIYKIV